MLRIHLKETFRDVKSARYGLGFELSGTYKTKRLQILLMIVMLALFVLWILGLVAKTTNKHRQYQANSIKNKNVLSVNFLGLRVANDKRFIMDDNDIIKAMDKLYDIAVKTAYAD